MFRFTSRRIPPFAPRPDPAVFLPRTLNLFRFHDADRPGTLDPPVTDEGDPRVLDERIREFLGARPGYQRYMMENHAGGSLDSSDYRRSPFVSMTTDPEAAARTRDRWLQEIVRNAPNLSRFAVPEENVFNPSTIELSQEEGERLILGSARLYRVETQPNPFRVRPSPTDPQAT